MLNDLLGIQFVMTTSWQESRISFVHLSALEIEFENSNILIYASEPNTMIYSLCHKVCERKTFIISDNEIL